MLRQCEGINRRYHDVPIGRSPPVLVAGVCLALLPFAPMIQLTKQLIFTAFLPPLIFEAAINLRWPDLNGLELHEFAGLVKESQ